MENSPPLLFDAIVSDIERPSIVAGMEQLTRRLGAATGIRWPIKLVYRASLRAVERSDRPKAVIASLLTELVDRPDTLASIEARWRNELSALRMRGVSTIFVCTIFRYVSANSMSAKPEARSATIEYIRRLNLLAAELSHDTGLSIIDIDRSFAHLGGRVLHTDCRLTGALAIEVAGHIIASTILAVGPDDFIPVDVQERAKKLQPSLREIEFLIAKNRQNHRLDDSNDELSCIRR